MDTRLCIISAINRAMENRKNKSKLFIGDIFDNDGKNKVGVFTLIYDDNGNPYTAAFYDDGTLVIAEIKTMGIKITVDKKEGVFSFPCNSANVSRVLLIDFYKVMQEIYLEYKNKED